MALALVVLAGCRTEARVEVDVDRDGSGTVTTTVSLDGGAAAALGDPSLVSLDDLTGAGWRVRGPRPTDDGGLRWVVSRPFTSPEDLTRALEEVGGQEGAFDGVRLRVEDGFGSTTYRFRARVDLTGDLAQFSDAELTAALGGVATGWTPEELAAAGATDADAAELVLAVRLPGDRPETDGRVVAGASTWRFPLTGGEPTQRAVGASATAGSTTPAVLIGGGVVLLAGAAAVAVAAVLRSRR
jgi:hypothetical protein